MHGGIWENGVAKFELLCGYFTLLSIKGMWDLVWNRYKICLKKIIYIYIPNVIDALGSRLNFMIFHSWLWNPDRSEFIHHFMCDPILRVLNDHQKNRI
jgi:hypothetical protein